MGSTRMNVNLPLDEYQRVVDRAAQLEVPVSHLVRVSLEWERALTEAGYGPIAHYVQKRLAEQTKAAPKGGPTQKLRLITDQAAGSAERAAQVAQAERVSAGSGSDW